MDSATKFDDKSVVSPQAKVMLTELQDGTGVLLHLGTKFYYTLNKSSVTIWKLLLAKKQATVAELAQSLVDKFTVEFEQALNDTRKILQDMADEELVSGD